MKLLPYVGLLMGLAGIGYGTFQMLDQRRLIEHGQPVSAKIMSSQVESFFNGHITEYKPKIRFDYTIDGRYYESSDVYPAEEEGRESWAREVVNRYPPGSTHKAYCDPRNPERAYLIRRYTSMPYVTVGFGLIMFAFGPFLFLQLRTKDAPHPPREQPDRWFALTPAWNVRRAGPVLTIGGIIYVAIGGLLFTDLYHRVEPPYGGLTIAYTIFYSLVALIMLGCGLYTLLSKRDVGEPIISIDRPIIRRGDSCHLRFEQTFWRPMTIKDVSLTLALHEERFHFHGQGGTSIEHARFSSKHEFLSEQQVREGQTLRHELVLNFPPEQPASTRRRWWTSPRHFWRIDLKTHIRGQLAYKCQYYVRVEEQQPADIRVRAL